MTGSVVAGGAVRVMRGPRGQIEADGGPFPVHDMAEAGEVPGRVELQSRLRIDAGRAEASLGGAAVLRVGGPDSLVEGFGEVDVIVGSGRVVELRGAQMAGAGGPLLTQDCLVSTVSVSGVRDMSIRDSQVFVMSARSADVVAVAGSSVCGLSVAGVSRCGVEDSDVSGVRVVASGGVEVTIRDSRVRDMVLRVAPGVESVTVAGLDVTGEVTVGPEFPRVLCAPDGVAPGFGVVDLGVARVGRGGVLAAPVRRPGGRAATVMFRQDGSSELVYAPVGDVVPGSP